MATKDGKKTGGRQKGTKNKYTKLIREKILELTQCFTPEDIKAVYKDLKEKKPEALLHFLAKVAPKSLDVDMDMNVEPSPMAKEIKKLREAHAKNNSSDSANVKP
jgi:hypothetical protein